MFSRARYFVAVGLAYALSLSCSGDDDDDAHGDAGAGGENAEAGSAAGGTSSSGSSAGGDSSAQGGTGPAQAGESPVAGAGAGGVLAVGGSGEMGGLAGDAGQAAGGAAGASAAGGEGGAAGASAAGGAGGVAGIDFSCDFPEGTPCYQSVAAGIVSHGQLIGAGGDITPGAVYVITIAAQGAEDVDLRVCASDLCQGDHVCESTGSSSEESCVVQATQDFVSVYVTNHAGAPANVRVDMDADTMFEFKLSYTQSQSSLQPNRSHRLLLTGLTPATTYALSVETGNARDVNLLVSTDLQAQQVLCDEDLVTTAAICEVTAPQSALWVLITDTSGLGDSYKFRVVAK